MATKQIAFGAAANAKGSNSAAARGIAYHQRVYKLLRMNFVLLGAGQPWKLEVEPWFKSTKMKMRSPDAVALCHEAGKVTAALVVEVKMNYKDGRDTKLLCEYVPIVSQVYGVAAKPLLIVGNIRGYAGPISHGLSKMWEALNWQQGDPTPTALVL